MTTPQPPKPLTMAVMAGCSSDHSLRHEVRLVDGPPALAALVAEVEGRFSEALTAEGLAESLEEANCATAAVAAWREASRLLRDCMVYSGYKLEKAQ